MAAGALQLLPLETARLRRVAYTFREYPTFLVLGHVANVVSSQLPVLLLATLFNPAIAGLYALAERVLVLPSSVIGSAIGDVYRQRAAAHYREFGHCRDLFLRTQRQLAILSVVPCLTIVGFGAPLFGWIFGEKWEASGALASILAGMIFFQMVSSPLSQTVYLAGMHRLDMIWQFTRLGVSASALFVGARLSSKPETAVLLYSIAFAVMHVVHSMMQYYAAKGRSALSHEEHEKNTSYRSGTP
jgi:O-antigen/teichoic acid export membrane protein